MYNEEAEVYNGGSYDKRDRQTSRLLLR